MDKEILQQPVGYGALLKTKGFTPYLISEFLSAFSDNIFKFFLMFLIASMFDHDTSADYISLIGALFVSPYLLFLGYSGYLSDRFSKRDIFVYVKLAEIIITSLILVSLLIGNIPFMLVCLFLMMTRSCIFFPAKVGLVPEMLDKSYLSLANSLLWMSVFLASIAGALLGGVLFQLYSDKQWMVGVILIGVAIFGYLNSLRIPKLNYTPLDKPFPINPWRDIIDSVATIRRRKSIAMAIFGIGWFWFLGALFQTILPLYGKQILQIDETSTALLQGFIGLGIAAGCGIAGWLSRDTYEPGLIPFGSLGIAVGTLWVAMSSHSYVQTSLAFLLTGFSAGLFIIPIYTFLHQRAKGNERGRIFATANYVDTLGMLIASGAYWVFNKIQLPEDKTLALFGVITLIITVYALKTLPIFFFRLVNFFITRISYRITVRGLENIPEKGGVILVPNHVSYIDGLLLWAACRKRNISFMIYHKMYHLKLFNWLFRILKYIPVYEGKRVKESLDTAKLHLQQGGTICIFPEGELTRTGSMLPFRRGVEKLIESIQSKNVPIIPVYIDQIWGSIFSYERGKFFFKIPHDFPSKISITFGKPLAEDTSSSKIRQAVTELGYTSVQQRKSKQDILPLELLNVAKKRWFSPMLTMPQMKPIRFGNVIARALNFIVALKHKLDATTQVVGVIANPSLFSVISNIALTFMNKTVVNLSPTLSAKDLDRAVKELNITEVITNHQGMDLKQAKMHYIPLEQLHVNALKSFIIATGLFFIPAAFVVRRMLGNKAMPDDIATMIWNPDKGKTSHITHYNILANAEGFSQFLFMRHNDWILAEASYQSTVGYIGQLWYPLLNAVGMACTNVDEDQLTVSTINALMRQYKVTLMISKTSFYRKILTAGQALTFPEVRFAVSIGNVDDESMFKGFESQIQVELFEGFGTRELPLVTSLNHYDYVNNAVKQLGNKKGSFGKPLPGVLMQIVHPKTHDILPAGEVGQLRIKGPNMVANAQTKDGWVYTKRHGFIDADGFVYLISDADATA